MRTLAAIPAYNEEVAIGSVVLRCRNYVDDVLGVDDGSRDATARIAQLAGAMVHRLGENQGKGAAIQFALDYARASDYDAVVFLDGDGQHDPDDIGRLLPPVLKGEADLVLGVRQRSTSHMPAYRRAGQRVLDYLTAVGAMDSVTDSQCGFRALSRTAVESLDLAERAFGVESEMLIEAKAKSLRLAEVPIRARYDVDGSTKGPLSHGVGVVDRVLRIIADRHPLLFFGVPGIVLFALGLWVGIDTMNTYNEIHLFAIGKAVLTLIFLMLGALSVFAGLLLNVMPRAVVRTLGNHRSSKPNGKGN